MLLKPEATETWVPYCLRLLWGRMGHYRFLLAGGRLMATGNLAGRRLVALLQRVLPLVCPLVLTHRKLLISNEITQLIQSRN